MKKIGIITFNETLNYGAILQAYALQKYIESLGYEAKIIDYFCEAINKREFPNSMHDVTGIKEQIKFVFGKKNREKKTIKFTSFEKEWMDITSRKFDKSNISDTNNDFDLFISGSDQVFNMSLTGGDTSYFLDFVKDNSKKCTYAASFGYTTIPEMYRKQTKEMLDKEFKFLSVREKQGVDIISKLCGISSEVVVDPTLLLDKKQWLSYLGLEKSKSENYILVYLPHDKKTVFSFAKKLAYETGYEIKYVNITYIPYPGVKNYYDFSPREFLEMLNNAAYVVTGSFHGTAFSINFEKEFFYEDSAASGKNGSRVANLVRIAGLENRRIGEHIELDSKIDFSDVRKRIAAERNKSREFLLKCIER